MSECFPVAMPAIRPVGNSRNHLTWRPVPTTAGATACCTAIVVIPTAGRLTAHGRHPLPGHLRRALCSTQPEGHRWLVRHQYPAVGLQDQQGTGGTGPPTLPTQRQALHCLWAPNAPPSLSLIHILACSPNPAPAPTPAPNPPPPHRPPPPPYTHTFPSAPPTRKTPACTLAALATCLGTH